PAVDEIIAGAAEQEVVAAAADHGVVAIAAVGVDRDKSCAKSAGAEIVIAAIEKDVEIFRRADVERKRSGVGAIEANACAIGGHADRVRDIAAIDHNRIGVEAAFQDI